MLASANAAKREMNEKQQQKKTNTTKTSSPAPKLIASGTKSTKTKKK